MLHDSDLFCAPSKLGKLFYIVLITPCVYVLVYIHSLYRTDIDTYDTSCCIDIATLLISVDPCQVDCSFFAGWAVSSTSWRCTSRDHHRARQLRVVFFSDSSNVEGMDMLLGDSHASMEQADLRCSGAKSQGCQWVVQFVVELVLVKKWIRRATERIKMFISS